MTIKAFNILASQQNRYPNFAAFIYYFEVYLPIKIIIPGLYKRKQMLEMQSQI